MPTEASSSAQDGMMALLQELRTELREFIAQQQELSSNASENHASLEEGITEVRKDLKQLLLHADVGNGSVREDRPMRAPSLERTVTSSDFGRGSFPPSPSGRGRRSSIRQVMTEHSDLSRQTVGGPRRTTFHDININPRRMNRSLDAGIRSVDGAQSFRPSTMDINSTMGSNRGSASRGVWPCNLRMREGLENNEASFRLHHVKSAKMTGMRSSTDLSMESANSHSKYALHPNSAIRIFFDLVGMVVLMMDLTITPFVLAWDLPKRGFIKGFGYVTPIYWMIDMTLSFFTGFYDGGELCMQLAPIAIHYLCTWFFIDITVIVCDWCSLLSATAHFKFILVLRIFRVVKFLQALFDRSISDGMIVSGVVTFVGVIWLVHVFSCGYYSIGRWAPADTGLHWLDLRNHRGGDKYEDLEMPFQYATAFHWAMQLVAAGSMDLKPTNTFERLFTSFCLCFGWLSGSYLVSIITTMVLDSRQSWQDKRLKLRHLQQYLHENNIRPELVARVQKQVRGRMEGGARLTERDVEALDMVSGSLRIELKREMFLDHVLRYPLFRVWLQADLDAITRVCNEAVDTVSFTSSDILFEAYVEAESAYVVIAGSVQYFQAKKDSDDESDEEVKQQGYLPSVEVSEGDVVCEAALWIAWHHVGSAEGQIGSQVLSVRAETLIKILKNFDLIRDVTQEYARCFHLCVVDARPPKAIHPNDIQVPFSEFERLVSSMEYCYRHLVSTLALKSAKLAHQKHAWNFNGDMDVLEFDARSGKSVFLHTPAGALESVVTTIAVELRRDNGDILVELGKQEDGRVSVLIQLPCAELTSGETTSSLCDQIISRIAISGVDVTSSDTKVSKSKSGANNVVSRSLLTVFHARMHGALDHNPVKLDSDDKLALGKLARHEIFSLESEEENSAKTIYAWLPRPDYEVLNLVRKGTEDSQHNESLVANSDSVVWPEWNVEMPLLASDPIDYPALPPPLPSPHKVPRKHARRAMSIASTS